MNKFTNKIAGKFKIFLPVALLILVAGIVLAAIFGMNTSPEYGSEKTLKIHVNSYYSEERVNAVETACAKVFSDKSVDESYKRVERSASANDYTIVYSFKGDFSNEKLNELRTEVAAKLTGENGALNGIDEDLVSVSASSSVPHTARSAHFILRAAIAGGVLLVAVFVYTAIRHKLAGGVIAAAITLVTLALTTALTVIVRVPVSSTCANALFLSTVLGAVYGVAVAGKMRKAETNEENEGLSAKEIVAKEMPEKPLLIATCALAVGIVLIGAMGISPVQWLSLIALLGLASAYFTAGILFPSIYPPIFEKLQKKRAAKRRYDYKKTKNAKPADGQAKKDGGTDSNEAEATAN